MRNDERRPGRRVFELAGGYAPEPIPAGWAAQQLPQGLPLIETIESEKGPWQQAGKYGRLLAAAFPASIDADPAAIFSIDRQPGPPRARTLHLFRSDAQLDVDPATTNADFYAQIVYGVGGIQNAFQCDWSRGGQIALVCDSLRVEAVPYAPNGSLEYLPPEGLQVLGAMLGREGTAPPRPPTFTTARIFCPAGFSVAFPVPDFARWVCPSTQQSGTNTTDRLLFRNLGSAILKSSLLNNDLIQLGTSLPGGTTEIQIDNNGPNQQNYVLQFELGL